MDVHYYFPEQILNLFSSGAFAFFLSFSAQIHHHNCEKLVAVITIQAFDHNIHLMEDEESSEELCHKECRVRQSHNTNSNIITLVDRNEQC